MELFAAEPEIVNPIDITWDERGRLWVVETLDYPNEFKPDRKGLDRIKDPWKIRMGMALRQINHLRAEGLNIPTGLVLANGGVIVAQAPDMLFFKDTDGTTTGQMYRKSCSQAGAPPTHTPARTTCVTGWITRSGAR